MRGIIRSALFGKLNTFAYEALERSVNDCKSRGNPSVTLEHWLLQILRLEDSDLQRIGRHFDLDIHNIERDVLAAIDTLPKGGSASIDLHWYVDKSTETAWTYATLKFSVASIRTGILLAAMLTSDHLKRDLTQISEKFARIPVDSLVDHFSLITDGSPEDGSPAHDGTRLFAVAPPNVREIFLSYRRSDSPYAAGWIWERLSSALGRDKVFKDIDVIPLGIKDFAAEIHRQLQGAKAMLVLVGPQWLEVRGENGTRRLDDPDDYVRIEIAWALENNIAVIPVLLDHAQVPDARSLPECIRQLSRCQASRVRAAPDFDSDLNRLVKQLRAIVGQRRDTSGG